MFIFNKKNIEKTSNQQEIKSEISKLTNDLENEIKKLEESIWVVDRFEENFAICENTETKEIKKIEKSILPNNIKEGTVLKYNENKYELYSKEQKKIEERIQAKMRRLWED